MSCSKLLRGETFITIRNHLKFVIKMSSSETTNLLENLSGIKYNKNRKLTNNNKCN